MRNILSTVLCCAARPVDRLGMVLLQSDKCLCARSVNEFMAKTCLNESYTRLYVFFYNAIIVFQRAVLALECISCIDVPFPLCLDAFRIVFIAKDGTVARQDRESFKTSPSDQIRCLCAGCGRSARDAGSRYGRPRLWAERSVGTRSASWSSCFSCQRSLGY